MPKRVVILGAGPGGYVAAVRAAQLGAAVTVVEAESPGGTCLNWGCIPSKVLITSAGILEKFRHASAYGIDVAGEIRPNMAHLMARKNTVIQNQVKGIMGLLAHHRIEYVQGRGVVKGPHLLGAETQEGAERQVPWDKLILATGTRPLPIPAFPFDGEAILSSNHALSLSDIPKSILILGGGVVGCEFAFIFKSLGSEVTLVEMMPRLIPLPSVDEECTKVLQREMKKEKIKFLLGSSVTGVRKEGPKLQITLSAAPAADPTSQETIRPATMEAEKMLVCVGRRPNTDDIGLENIGLAPNEKGWLEVNDRMETGAADVYAIGDILGPEKIMLAHVASAEGQIAAENAMGVQREMDYTAVPNAIFTRPEIATVGLSESQASVRGFQLQADTVQFRSLGKAHVMGEIAGLARIISEAVNGKILGVHMIGPHATDLIAEATLAIRKGATVSDIATTIHAHPTLSEIMAEAALKATDRALHG